MKSAEAFIALLRGVNVGGHNKVPMAELCALALELGWRDAQSYIQSGNLVFSASGPPSSLAAKLEQAMLKRLKLSIPTVVCSGAAWAELAKGNPFQEEAATEPNRVLLAMGKEPPKPGAAAALQERAADGERVEQSGDVLWIYFPQGVGKSKLTPALIDRLVGSPVTARNWRTVLKLREMAEQLEGGR